jgi:hypothetical protein
MEIPFRRREFIVALGGAAAWSLPVSLRAEFDAFIRRRHYAGNNAGRLAVRTSVSPRGPRRTRTRSIPEHPEHRILLLHAQTCLVGQSDRDCSSIRCENPFAAAISRIRKNCMQRSNSSSLLQQHHGKTLSPDYGHKGSKDKQQRPSPRLYYLCVK